MIFDARFSQSIQDFMADINQAADSERQVAHGFLRGRNLQEERERSFTWILGQSGLPWLELDLQWPFEKMLQEARNVRKRFVSHRSGGEQGSYVDGNHGWQAVCLHGLAEDKTASHNVYGYPTERDVPYVWTEVAKQCPVTKEAFHSVYPCEDYYRVRYTLLEPGGYIYPHVDRGVSALWEVNLALYNPTTFFFKMKDCGYVPFQNGKAFILDVSREHSVANLSKDEERIHMIIHGNPIRHLGYQRMIERSYQKFVNKWSHLLAD